MKSPGQNATGLGSLRASLCTAFVSLLMLGLLGASSASAFEQVATFAGNPTPIKEGEEFSEEVQLGGVTGMAVNYTGAGGVPAGTIYAATYRAGVYFNPGTRISRFNPDRSFSENWKVLAKKEEEEEEGAGRPPYERCGPEGDPTYPHCAVQKNALANSAVDVAVDQTTGYVYAFNGQNVHEGEPTIIVYSPDGSEVITRFAERAPGNDTIPESPGKVHRGEAEDIAVDSAGTVYVFDRTEAENFYHRLMVWKPQSPGDYEHYVYTGQGNDIGAGKLGVTLYPNRPAVDAAGFVYTATEETIEKYDPNQPGDPPLCSYRFKKSGIETMTVNPLSGEVFFASYLSRKIHRLSACKEGKFTELETLESVPSRWMQGLAVDPVREFSPGRPAGILYAGSPAHEFGESSGLSSLGYVFAPANETPPEVLSAAVSLVTQSSARFDGQVNPKGTPSRFAFQYIADAAYQANAPGERFTGAGEAPAGGGPIEGSKPIPVGEAVGGLQPDTLYHFRLIAISHCKPATPAVECVGTGPERTFRTYPDGGLGLPDGRAYELVSPTEKNGGQVFPVDPGRKSCLLRECKPGWAFNHFPMRSAPDGDAVVYEGDSFSYDVGAIIENQYIARRDPTSGWHSVNLTPSRLASKGRLGYQAFKDDLSEGVLGQTKFPLTEEGPAGYGNLYLQPSADPTSLERLLSQAPPNRSAGVGQGSFVFSFGGASADFSRLFFAANDALTEATPFAPAALDGGEGKFNLYEWSGGQLALLNVAPGNATSITGAAFASAASDSAISADGSRVFWSSESGQVYVRENGEVTKELTDHAGNFLAASTDGSKVLLTDGCLYDLATDACQDLTQGQGGFLGTAGQSEDLSHVYFADTAVLTGEEQNSHGDKAQAGQNNLYAWHNGVTHYIATLKAGTQDNISDWAPAPGIRTARASSNGEWLAFTSIAPLTGFDNTGPCAAIASSENYIPAPCGEVFLYRASTGDLRCASCTPSGAAPAGPSLLPTMANSEVANYLTDSGRLYFDSQDTLSPADTNGRVEDVYEFEPAGVGSCERAAGCVSLISLGRFGVDSNFFNADPSARNVFFTSRDKLVGPDKDELVDLYDAREGGGFPLQAGSAECQGEACVPAATPPDFPTPASSSLRGSGNVKHPARCPKGKAKRHGKCVKKHRAKKKHKRHQRKLHHNRGGAK
jgi:hypothetical protein